MRYVEAGNYLWNAGIFVWNVETISIDFAVIEPAASNGLGHTHPADFGWSDLGNWASLHDKHNKDVKDAHKVVLQGLDGYIVREENGQVLVCGRSEELLIREFSGD